MARVDARDARSDGSADDGDGGGAGDLVSEGAPAEGGEVDSSAPDDADAAAVDGDALSDSDAGPLSCDAGAGFNCLLGGCSNDVAVAAVCQGGTWGCPPGSIDIATCGGCSGHLAPGCTCRAGHITCSDAGADGPAAP